MWVDSLFGLKLAIPNAALNPACPWREFGANMKSRVRDLSAIIFDSEAQYFGFIFWLHIKISTPVLSQDQPKPSQSELRASFQPSPYNCP